jgi:serine/threonine-protein kinase
MSTGLHPFRADSIPAVIYKIVNLTPIPAQQIVPDIPEGLNLLLEKLLAKAPEQRHASAGQVRTELLKFKGMT